MRKEKGLLKRVLAKLLVFALVFQMAVPVGAAPVVEEISVAEAVEDMAQEAVAPSEAVTEEDVLPETAAGDGFEIDENGVLVKYTGNAEEVVVPDTVTTIGERAFDNCTMKKVVFPDSVTKIEMFAFYQCANIEELVLPNVPTLDSYNDVMIECGTEEKRVKIVVPESLTDKYFYDGFSIGCTYSGTQTDTPVYFEVSEDNEVYTSDKYGMLYKWTENNALELCALAGGTIEEYVLPKKLEKITLDDYNDHIENIKSIKLNTESSLWEPEWENGRENYIVFENLEKVIIPKGAAKLAKDMIDFAEVFGNVPTFEVEEGNTSFVVENNVIYSYDKKTLLFYPTSKEDKEFEIPETVEVIGKGAFLYVDNLNVILPENLKEIEQFSFYEKSNSNVYIYTNGSKPEPKEMMSNACVNVSGLCIDKTEDGESEQIWIDYFEKIDNGRIYEAWLEDLTTILAPNYVDSPTLKVSGYGYFDTDKEMVFLCDGQPIDTVTPNPVTLDFKHRWAATLQLPITEETEDGTQFRISVQIGENTSEEVIVTYKKAKLPEVIDADLRHFNKEYSIDLEKCPSKVVTYVSGCPLLQVELELEDTENVLEAYCITDGNETYPIKKDEKTGKWVIQIPLNDGAKNLPEILKMECVVDTAAGNFTYNFLNICLSWIIDPSGYIYEAVPENRVEGAQMTIYQKKNQYDNDSTAWIWEAEPYYQKNPIMTDAEGRYAWDVPKGWWQVVAEKDGYEVTKSNWLQVPPPQLNVNLELVSTEKPSVATIELSSAKMKIEFSKYVKTASVEGKISLSTAGENVAISSLKPMNVATRYGEEIASVFEVEFESTLDASKTYTAAFASDIESYADTAMVAAEVTNLKVEGIVTGLDVQENMLLENEKAYVYEVTVAADQNLEGRKVSVTSSDEEVVKATKTALTDKDGKASIVVKGYKAGSAQLTFTVEGTRLSKTANAMVLYDSSVADELQESLGVEIPEETDQEPVVSDNDIPKDPEDPSVSGNDVPKDPEDPSVSNNDVPKDPENPSDPTDPEDPSDPTEPEDPKDPTEPEDPSDPTDPEDPSDPTEPEDPKDPTEPETPALIDISRAVVTGIEDKVYTGSALTQDIRVAISGKVLVKDIDYTVTYKNNTEVGTAKVIITGIGDYTGTKTVTFTIKKAESTEPEDPSEPSDPTEPEDPKDPTEPEDPSDPTEPEDPKDPTEPEEPSEPVEPSVSDNDVPKDPTVSENNVPADLAKAVVTGIVNKVYTGRALTQDLKVTVDGKVLANYVDYTVAYKNNTEAGTAEAIITGKGSYTGSKTVTFMIAKAASTLKAENAVYNKAYGAKAFTVKVTGATGTVTYTSSDAKVAKVSASGKVSIKNTGRAVITASVAESKNYKAGKVEIVIEVSPKKASIKTLASKKAKQLTVTWKKDKKATGYEISYSTSKKFKKSQTKIVLVKKAGTTKATLKNLKKGKTYYVKVRAYKEVKVNGKKVKIYSPYSKVLKKKVK